METEEIKVDKKDISSVKYSNGFSVETHNILDEPKCLHFSGYESLNLEKLQSDNGKALHSENLFNVSRVTDKTSIIIILRYFEYACVANVSFRYLCDIMNGEITLIQVFDMIKHHLRILLNKEVDRIEDVVELHVEYYGKVKY